MIQLSPKQCECGKQGYSVDSRQHKKHVRRRYECECGARWTTYEIRTQEQHPEAVFVRHLREELSDQLISAAMRLKDSEPHNG